MGQQHDMLHVDQHVARAGPYHFGKAVAKIIDFGLAKAIATAEREMRIGTRSAVTPIGVLPRMRSFTVSGIISVGMYDYDRRIAIMSLTDAAAPNDQTLDPGSYSVAEMVPAGWSLSSLVVTDPSGWTALWRAETG